MIKLDIHEFEERDLIRRVLLNLPRATGRKPRQFRWVVVRDLFGVGSTVANALCREFDMDPEEMI